jgi:hypothetical protein
MTWFRSDDSFYDHPKVRRIPRRYRLAACGLWQAMGAYCARHATDGRFTAEDAFDLLGTPALVGWLVEVGLWERDDAPVAPPAGNAGNGVIGGVAAEACNALRFHDWADYQETRKQVMSRRKTSRERVARWREKQAGQKSATLAQTSREPRADLARASREPREEAAVSQETPSDQGLDDSVTRYNDVTSRARARSIPDRREGMDYVSFPPRDDSLRSSSQLEDRQRGDVERLCRRLADRVEANGSKRPTITKAWRDAARLMLDRDGRTEDQIAAAIDWCQGDEFWLANVMSMTKLRTQYDRLRLAAARQQGNGRVATTTQRVNQALEVAAALKAKAERQQIGQSDQQLTIGA